jgi:NAD-dependent SIR2 family protein deacetylase
MSDTIKCRCEHCGAKYRLPVEAQGRTAKCKRCGEKFSVPREMSLEDSVLTWLSANVELEETDEDLPTQPKIISMPKSESSDNEDDKSRGSGPIRMKSKSAGNE